MVPLFIIFISSFFDSFDQKWGTPSDHDHEANKNARNVKQKLQTLHNTELSPSPVTPGIVLLSEFVNKNAASPREHTNDCQWYAQDITDKAEKI